jgi:long-chain acyl-CoA synthetase
MQNSKIQNMNKKYHNIAEIILQSYLINNPKAVNLIDKELGIDISLSGSDFFKEICYFAYGIKKLSLTSSKIAIFAYQSPFWLIADYAIICSGNISVPIFHNISSDNFNYQIANSGCGAIFIDNIDILSDARFNFSHFEKIIILNQKENYKELEDIANSNISNKIITYHNFIADAKNDHQNNHFNYLEFWQRNIAEIQPEQVASIIYSSGTTSMPKGVLISHKNLVSQIIATAEVFILEKSDKALSFLPLAHIFEKMVMLYYISCGIEVYFASDIKKVADLLMIVKPNLMTTVPRMLEKLFNKIKQNGNDKNLISRIIFNNAINDAIGKDITNNIRRFDFVRKFKNKIFDLLIYRKIRLKLGGNLRMIICGGAPLNRALENFYWNVKVRIFCGYGLTETSPVIATNHPKLFKIGTVGTIYNCNKVKIAEDGEILVKGDSVFLGYYNNQEENEKSFIDGWFKTGDLANIDDYGFVTIIGRKKEVLKTSNGKFIRPNFIEQKFLHRFDFIDYALVVGDNRQFASILLFIDKLAIVKLSKKLKYEKNKLIISSNKNDLDNFINEFIQSSLLIDYIEKNIEIINAELDHSEQIKKFIVINDELSIENNQLTPSLKLKRSIVEKHYQMQIDNLYQNF